jgi:DNA invertase Pin-like site-specific DNA recombinase
MAVIWKGSSRLEFEVLMKFVREGYTVAVHSMGRFDRNPDDLRQIVKKLTKRGKQSPAANSAFNLFKLLQMED